MSNPQQVNDESDDSRYPAGFEAIRHEVALGVADARLSELDADEQEDVIERIAVKAWSKHLESTESLPLQKVRAYAAKGAHNAGKNHSRGAKSAAKAIEEYESRMAASRSQAHAPQLERVLKGEFWQAVFTCAHQFSARAAGVIIAVYYYGRSVSEAAAEFDMTPNAAYKTIERVLPKLQTTVAPWAGPNAFGMFRAVLNDRPAGIQPVITPEDQLSVRAQEPKEPNQQPIALVVDSREKYELAKRQDTKFQKKIRPVAGTEVPTLPPFIPEDYPDEYFTIPQIEREWKRFCASIGLTEVPDIRSALIEHAQKRQERPAFSWRSHPWRAFVHFWNSEH